VLDYVSSLLNHCLSKAARGQVGTRKQWTEFIVKPIKLGHRLDADIGPLVASIVSLLSNVKDLTLTDDLVSTQEQNST
jgi:hypothetical protein